MDCGADHCDLMAALLPAPIFCLVFDVEILLSRNNIMDVNHLASKNVSSGQYMVPVLPPCLTFQWC